MNFETITKELTDVRKNKNGSVTLSFITRGDKEAFVKTVDLKAVKAIYYAFREGRALKLTVADNNLVSVKVI